MRRHRIICAGLLFLPLQVTATTITIEPDSYVPGTDLISISPYATVSTTGGNPVYASTIDQGSTLAAGGASTGPLGDAVFSLNSGSNREWSYWPELGDDQNGLAFTFSQPVLSFSLLFAELFYDAGCCINDPVRIFIYAPDNSLIEVVSADASPPDGYLGTDHSIRIVRPGRTGSSPIQETRSVRSLSEATVSRLQSTGLYSQLCHCPPRYGFFLPA